MSDTTELGTALATIETTNFALVFVPGGVEAIVTQIEREVRKQAEKMDATTPKGRAARRSLGFKVARSKTTIDDAGKELKAEWQAKIAPIDGDRREARDRLTALRTEIEAPADEYDTMQKLRTDAHEAAIQQIITLGGYGGVTLASWDISQKINELNELHTDRNWEEFAGKAAKARAASMELLSVEWHGAKTREDEAEAQRVAAEEEAERQRIAAAEAQRLREAQIAREAAENARLAAEAHAARVAKDTEERAEAALKAAEALRQHQADEAARKEREATEALERAENERLAGLERERLAKIAAEKAATEAAKKAETDRLAAIEVERQQAVRERQRADYHRSMLQHVKNCGFGFIGPNPQPVGLLQYELTEKIKYDEENFGDLLKEALVAKEAALALIQKSIDEANRRHAEEAERQRVAQKAEAKRVEDEKRAADKEHRGKINREIAADVITAISEVSSWNPDHADRVARAVVTALAKRQIRHCEVRY